MNKVKFVFRFFDNIFRNFYVSKKKTNSSGDLILYRNDKGSVAFVYSINQERILFNYDDFFLVSNMFNIPTSDLVDICKEYVLTKFNINNEGGFTFMPTNFKSLDKWN